jgi:thiamine-monophosphate kinase
MTENEVIQEIFELFELNHTAKGFGHFGDDAVVIPAPSAQDQLVLSTDSFCDGTHFDSNIEWSSVGWKALVSSLSDIVAMGAQPSFYLLNLILTSEFKSHKELLNGFLKASQKYNVSLLGGDVSKGNSLALTVTVGGYQAKSHMKTNSGASIGDLLYTNAPLGYALLGFEELKRSKSNSFFVKQFLYPETPVELGLWLSQKAFVTGLRDVSDGLLSELRQMATDYSVKLVKPELDSGFIEACKKINLDPEVIYFKGGEDYTLLWSVDKNFIKEFESDYKSNFTTPPILVGEVVKSNSETKIIYEPNQSLTDSIIPFEHFSSNEA